MREVVQQVLARLNAKSASTDNPTASREEVYIGLSPISFGDTIFLLKCFEWL